MCCPSTGVTPLLPPIEGKWQRYRREVREAAAYLASQRAALDPDRAKALVVIQRWVSSKSDSIPPEPEATRTRTAAIMHKAGTLKG